MTISNKNLAAIFNEWAKRYSENPNIFGLILDDNGQPISDYGEKCSKYIQLLNKELFE